MDQLAQIGMFLLGQLKKLPPEDPRLGEAGSEMVPLIIGGIIVIGIIAIAFRPSKRDRVEND